MREGDFEHLRFIRASGVDRSRIPGPLQAFNGFTYSSWERDCSRVSGMTCTPFHRQVCCDKSCHGYIVVLIAYRRIRPSCSLCIQSRVYMQRTVWTACCRCCTPRVFRLTEIVLRLFPERLRVELPHLARSCQSRIVQPSNHERIRNIVLLYNLQHLGFCFAIGVPGHSVCAFEARHVRFVMELITSHSIHVFCL